MLGPAKARRLDELVITSLELLVPPGNPYRDLEAKLDLSFVRDCVGDLYADCGRPSIDPVVFLKLQLILFFEGLRSERKLVETASLHLAHRWYLGYALDEPLPDHSSLTRIRHRLGVGIFQRFFERVVELCQEAGLVWGKELFFDGTRVVANADIDSLTPRFAQAAREHVDHLFTNDSAPTADSASPGAPAGETLVTESEPQPAAANARALPADAAAEGNDTGHTTTPAEQATAPTALPFSGTETEQAALASENEAQWKLLDQHRLDPNRPPSGPYRRITDFRVSTTDPDAAPIGKGAVGKLGYHDHYAVDGGKARIIVGVLVTPADVQDNQAFLDLLDRVRFRFHLQVRRAIADSKYGTGEILRELAERGITAYMPVADHEQSGPFFKHKDFMYEPETDSYRCPQGQVLTFRGNSYTTRSGKYEAPAAVCAACPVRADCTEGSKGRVVSRSFDEDYRELAKQQQTTEAYKKALRKRQVWVEPMFGEAKEWHQLRKFRLRGLDNVNIQGLLIAAGQNLKRLLAASKRGNRPTVEARHRYFRAVLTHRTVFGMPTVSRFSTGCWVSETALCGSARSANLEYCACMFSSLIPVRDPSLMLSEIAAPGSSQCT